MILYLRPRLKITIYGLIALLVLQVAIPVNAFALTEGPKSPEFSKFQPVAITDMVNHFSGDFTYNLPVLNVPGPDRAGYSLSLSYQSGASSEQEASWVGHGWTLNPGAINRNLRGLPDDYMGVNITRYNKTLPNWTIGITRNEGGLEVFGFDKIQVSQSNNLRLNNTNGYHRSKSFGLSFWGLVSLNMNSSAEGMTFSANINPIGILQLIQKKDKENKNRSEKKNDEQGEKQGIDRSQYTFKAMTTKALERKAQSMMGRMTSLGTSGMSIFSFSETVRNSVFSKYTGGGVSISRSNQINPVIFPIGVEFGFNGNYNFQRNIPETSFASYGFIHSPNRATYREHDGKVISDHYVEKEMPYQKRDFMLGIPFGSPDHFNVAGEGISGGFRYYPRRVGHFYSNHDRSDIPSGAAGLETMIAANVGIGLDLNFQIQSVYSSDWEIPGNTSDYQFDSGGFFRFNNDLGGKIEFADNTEVTSAKLASQQGLTPSILSTIKRVINEEPLSSRYIKSHTFRELTDELEQNPAIDSYFPFLNQYAAEDSRFRGETLCAFSITKEDGAKHVYGLPVFSQNKIEIQVNASQASRKPCPPGSFEDCTWNRGQIFQPLHFSNTFPEMNLDEHDIAVGEVQKAPFAEHFLLTSIVAHDFIDRHQDGPDERDFGAWTKFHYRQHYSISEPYRYRTPYTGLLFAQNSISDTKDDLASVFTGEKEIYTLKAIETKSHIAFFVTNKSTLADFRELIPDDVEDIDTELLRGSFKDRLDGLGASAVSGTSDPHAESIDEKGEDSRLVYLERIVLFSKNRFDRPLVTTHFSYHYSLVKNLPNNSKSAYPNDPRNINDYLQSGKLTLERVWFTYEGNRSTRISPYEFNYEARSNFPSSLIRQYPWLEGLNRGYSDKQQNPDYSPFLLDSWGQNQANGGYRKVEMLNWPDQSLINRSTADPAAWQLKRIRLPSGGEILVDYEAKDYSYVQNRTPMAMCPLLASDLDSSMFTLDVQKIGVDPTDELLMSQLRDACRKSFLGTEADKKKAYFKFLFAFKDETPDFDNCDSEYITGYVSVASVDLVRQDGQDQLVLTLDQGQNQDLSPKNACYDMYTGQRLGVRERSLEEESGEVYQCFYPLVEDDRTMSAAESSLNEAPGLFKIIGIMINLDVALRFPHKYSPPDISEVCRVIDDARSFIKVPMVTAKQGGGVRVKRLLMYDAGLGSDGPVIYGKEYRYTQEDGRSSGVATTEPSAMREENALVSFLPRGDQSLFSKLTVGPDVKQVEGPIGESILPAPSIGHARVEVHNIYQGRTGKGYQVYEYHTVKDYPFDEFYNSEENNDVTAAPAVAYSELSDNMRESKLNLPGFLFDYSIDKMWATQGFRFIVNNMHGQPKSEQTYGYSADGRYFLSAGKRYTYYQPGEKVWLLSPQGKLVKDNPGKEMDIAMVEKSIGSTVYSPTIEVDVGIGLAVPPPIAFTAIPSFSMSENELNTHVTSKVVRYPAITKSIESFVDGTQQRTDFLVFDQYTGQPVVTRTTDEYDRLPTEGDLWDGGMYTIQIPASHKYPEMGPVSANSTYSNQLGDVTATLRVYGEAGHPDNWPRTNDVTVDWQNFQQVLSGEVKTYATAQSQQNNWFGQAIRNEYDLPRETPSELAEIWRPFETYVFNGDVKEYDPANGQTLRESGMIKDFQMFDWTANAAMNGNNGWLRQSRITKYTPHGMPVEEVDVLDRYYCLRYSNNYQNLLPSIRAANARYTTVVFEDFEVSSADPTIISGGHSGAYAFRVIPTRSNELDATLIPLAPLYYTRDLQNSKGAWVKVWVKNPVDANILKIRINGDAMASAALEKVASTGEWSLYRALLVPDKFIEAGLSPGSLIRLYLECDREVIIDDFRFQPYDAQATCYVYDHNSLRLLAQFDDQHFGLYYRYNGEGQLTFKEIETERGMKTIQETQYHTPKIPVQE